MQCEQNQRANLYNINLFYSVLNSLIRYLNLNVKNMERLDGKNLIPTHMKNKTRYCKHKHVTLSENDISRGAFLTSASLQINDKSCKAFCSSRHTQVFIRVHTCVKFSFFIQPLHMRIIPSVLISEQALTVF